MGAKDAMCISDDPKSDYGTGVALLSLAELDYAVLWVDRWIADAI